MLVLFANRSQAIRDRETLLLRSPRRPFGGRHGSRYICHQKRWRTVGSDHWNESESHISQNKTVSSRPTGKPAGYQTIFSTSPAVFSRYNESAGSYSLHSNVVKINPEPTPWDADKRLCDSFTKIFCYKSSDIASSIHLKLAGCTLDPFKYDHCLSKLPLDDLTHVKTM